jgi:hypothetical protein
MSDAEALEALVACALSYADEVGYADRDEAFSLIEAASQLAPDQVRDYYAPEPVPQRSPA